VLSHRVKAIMNKLTQEKTVDIAELLCEN